MTTRCPRNEWHPDFYNEQTKRVVNNDVRTPEARTRPDSASFFSPLSPRIMIMIVFSPTPRQHDEGWVGRRADSAATLGESRRAEKHRGGDTTRVSHTSSPTWPVGWNTGDWSAYHPPIFCLWTVLRATDTLALSSVFSLLLVEILCRSFIALSLSLSLFQWLKLYFNLRTTPLFQYAHCRLFGKDQMWICWFIWYIDRKLGPKIWKLLSCLT